MDRRALFRLASLKLSLLDFIIALGRKIAAFCALLTLGWIYFRLLALGQTPHQVYPDAADPELRHTLWVALFLIMAQGWDIPTDEILRHWAHMLSHLPAGGGRSRGAHRRLPQRLVAPGLRAWRMIEPMIAWLGRFMDLCVAIANKVGALAVLFYLVYLTEQLWWAGVPLRQMYPTAADPMVSLLADLCVYVVVLGWWAMPFERIGIFWRRLRGPADKGSRPPPRDT